MLSQHRLTGVYRSSSHAKVWHITSQKHDIHIKCSKCSFFSLASLASFPFCATCCTCRALLISFLWRRTTACILQQRTPAIIRQTDAMIPITEERTFSKFSFKASTERAELSTHIEITKATIRLNVTTSWYLR